MNNYRDVIKAPIITEKSIDKSIAYLKSRYDKGEASYINCPMNKEEYEKFYNELINAEVVTLHEFEKKEIFEGCMPIEIMAKRGRKKGSKNKTTRANR